MIYRRLRPLRDTRSQTAPAIAALLYGIHVIDPIVFLAVPLILLVVSLAASYIPARQATKVSPIVALHEV